MRHRLLLFVVSCGLGGLGGVLGSIVGNAGGKTGLFVGGIGIGVLNDVFGDRVEVFVGRLMKVEPVAVGEGVPVAVGVSSGLTGRSGISAM